MFLTIAFDVGLRARFRQIWPKGTKVPKVYGILLYMYVGIQKILPIM